MGDYVNSRDPANASYRLAQSGEPAAGEARVEVLKGNDYVRVWLNRSGTFYLVHLPIT